MSPFEQVQGANENASKDMRGATQKAFEDAEGIGQRVATLSCDSVSVGCLTCNLPGSSDSDSVMERRS